MGKGDADVAAHPIEVPGIGRLLWMLFMQPIRLHDRLHACGIDPNASAWRLWRRHEHRHQATRAYLARAAVILLFTTPLVGAASALAVTSLGIEIDPFRVAAGVAAGVAFGVAAGVAGGVVAIASFTRVIVYPLEAVFQTGIYFFQRVSGPLTLQFSPVLWHDLSYLPHPFLASHIIDSAAKAPALVRQVLDVCPLVPGQRRTAAYALRVLQTRELDEAGRALDFAGVASLQGQWLPGSEAADPPLLALRDVARYIRAAQSAAQPYHRLTHLQRAQRDLEALQNRLVTERSEWSRLLPAVVETWRHALRAMGREAQAAAAGSVPNPFRAGEPLEPGHGKELFRGRNEIVGTIENLLADPQQSVSIALLGARRCGKTSLLKMLPGMLPDTLCVLFDIQDNPIDSPAGFFAALAKRAAEQARKDGGKVPALPNAAPFEAASQWLRDLDESRRGRRVLLCLDEFERLEDLWPGDRRELLQLMGLLRGTIQHRRNVRLLVSGAAPFHELGPLWNDHFVNARMVRVGHLDEATAIDLLTGPTPEFPKTAIPREVAREVFLRTGGQPYLLQLYGSLLVTRLNDQRRSGSVLDDIDVVEADVLDQATYYLRHTVTDAPEPIRAVLKALACGEEPTIDASTRRWLAHRGLINAHEQLAIPVLGTWIREEFDVRKVL